MGRNPEAVAATSPTSGATPDWNLDTIRLVGVAMVGALFSSDAWNNVTFTAGEVRNPKRNLPLSLALGVGIVSVLYLALQSRLPQRAAARGHSERPAGSRGDCRWRQQMFGPVGVQVAGRRHHDLDLRLRQRHAFCRRARLLRDGAGRALLPPGGRTRPQVAHAPSLAVAAMRLGLPAYV